MILTALLLAQEIKIGSKRFPESHLLAEIVARIAEEEGEARVERRLELAGTIVAFTMLESGDLDIYPEYTGTIAQAILKTDLNLTTAEIDERLRDRGLAVTGSLGFNNTYAIAVRRELADARNLRAIGDLRAHPDLIVGVSSEFLDRHDGWKPLAQRYRLAFDKPAAGMEHKLAYQAIQSGQIHVMDAYATDAELRKYDLVVLEDDLKFFPDYSCVFIYRLDLPARTPKTFRRLQDLEGRINEASMIDLNGQVVFEERAYEAVAAEFLGLAETERADPFWRWTREHATFVGLAVLACVALGVPLGVVGARVRAAGHAALIATGVGYTIPSLALFALLIPLVPGMTLLVLIGLVMAGLLPIVRNTITGLRSIDPALLEAADALGLTPAQRLFRIELPLASRTILAGIKTSAVIAVGAATIAAFLGVGGYGEPIITGLTLLDTGLMLRGAIPAAAMALLVTALFEALDRVLVPRGLRLAS